jgi:ferrous-iron efflux pump FieF
MDTCAGIQAPYDDPASARLRRLATYASVTTATLLIAAKLGAWLLTDSVAMLSSLADSTVDLMASVVTLYGVAHATRPPDKSHRYGHGKAEALAAMAQAAFITGSAGVLVYEAISRFVTPAPIRHGLYGVAVIAFAIAATLALLAFQRLVVRRTGSVAIAADSVHYRGDLLVNAAVIAAIGLGAWTGSPYWDPALALLIAGYLAFAAWQVGREALDVLMDRELSGDERHLIERTVMGHDATRGIHDLRTRNAGDRIFIELHLQLDGGMTLEAAHDIAHEVEELVRAQFPAAEVIVHQEPEGAE